MKFSSETFKTYLIFTLGSFILCVLGMAGLNAAIDPLHILRAPAESDVYDRESRFAMPGMMMHNAAPHAIVGTSVVQDFDEAYYKDKTGEDISRFLLTGGTGYEQRRMLETLMGSDAPPRRVIWGLDVASFTGPLESIRWDRFPEHLFIPRPFWPEYVFSFQTFHRLVRQIPDRLYFKDGYKTPYERFRPEQAEMNFGQENIFKTYCGDKMTTRIARLQEFDFDMQGPQVARNLVTPIKENPDTEFLLFFPPYSLVQFAEYAKADVLDEVFAFRRTVTEQIRDLKNARLYDFQGNISLISDFKNYRDSVHYGRETMHEMTDAFLSDADRARTVQDVESGNKNILRALEKPIWPEIERYCINAGTPIALLKN